MHVCYFHPYLLQAREKRKLYPEAWEALKMANEHMRSVNTYSTDSDLHTLGVLTSVFKRAWTSMLAA